ncbi:nicotinamide mononucleotide transporter [bacterium]|nr:nicotinamide mononucleotide transporter [bacterium]
MRIDKVEIKNKFELYGFILVYIILFSNAIITHDSIIALVSAFCGITYTILAGKGFPVCYLIGVIGSIFYSYLSFKSALWGNLILYAFYYVPMQIAGFFHWSKNLKTGKSEIIKIHLKNKERLVIFTSGVLFSLVTALVLAHMGDKNPLFDSITTVFSILGMYLTVRRAIEQWIIWIIVNGLSFLMCLEIASSGTKVYSTVIMWGVYFILAVYFYRIWKKEVK